ncbi:MAG: response regulator [Deltaproteobacteria bacterium]|nr:response regulator [Deltaproteobacteria bacterium]MBW2020201.1 response regulator [Deltaproteobacteria bacterium]MBW2075101.1 response regulator [Deltaproteobacteria bacterium]RLB81524.1 MAG: sigma-54-dependent Fis family transcriptional regulator [Deltaproteobacteria bacterium]
MDNLKILIVEDDPVTLKLIEKRLMKVGYKVETAKSGVEAVDLVSTRFFDVVVTDLMLPGGVDGIDTLEAIKAKWPETEVILITAHATVDSAVEAMKKGAVDYLQKPINFDELILRLQRISTLKSLAKDANDFREAMNVTEKSAAKTIQDLEIMVSELQQSCLSAKNLLSDQDIEINERVRKAIEVLSSRLPNLLETSKA